MTMRWGDTSNWKKPEPVPAQPLHAYLADLLAYAEKNGAPVVSVPVERVQEMLTAITPEPKMSACGGAAPPDQVASPWWYVPNKP